VAGWASVSGVVTGRALMMRGDNDVHTQPKASYDTSVRLQLSNPLQPEERQQELSAVWLRLSVQLSRGISTGSNMKSFS
jgi:hypothetical protein